MKKLLKNIATPLVASAIIVAGLAGAAATDAIPNPLPNAVAGNVIKATDINELATAVGILDERTENFGINGALIVDEYGSVKVGNSGNINIPTESSGNANLGFDGSDFKITSNSSSANLKLETASTTRLTVDAVGNVGIGTTAPSAKLELKAGLNELAFEPGITASESVNGSGLSFNFTANGNTNVDFARIDASLLGGGNGFNTGYLSFYTAPNVAGNPDVEERMRIKENGEIIINNLTGSGNAFACVTDTGTLYRSATACN